MGKLPTPADEPDRPDPIVPLRPHREAKKAELTRLRHEEKLAEWSRELRAEWDEAGIEWTDVMVAQAAELRWLDSLTPDHPHLRDCLKITIPISVSPHRLPINPKVEVHAIRMLPECQALERALMGGEALGQVWPHPAASGKERLDSGRLATGMLLEQMMASHRPNLYASFHRFAESHPLQHWAFGYPWDGRVKTYQGALRGLHSVCGRTNPDVAVFLNVEAFKRLAATLPQKSKRLPGLYMAIDGEFIPASREQVESKSPLHEQLLNRGLPIDYGWHGDNGCRGWSVVVLVDILTTLPVIWSLRPSDRREFTGVTELVETLLRLWPECPIEYLVGDSEYDQGENLAYDLEARWGIHPAFYKRGEWGQAHLWAETDGTPKCSQHGLMRLQQSQGFFAGAEGRAKRRAVGIQDGQAVNLRAAFHRWYCPVCQPEPRRGKRTYTRFMENPRLYAFLPRRGDAPRVGLRQALGHRRNAAESVIASLESWGIGLTGKAGPFWCNKPDDMPWLINGALASMTFRRLAHAEGRYETSLAEAKTRGYLTPPTCDPTSQTAGRDTRADAA